MNNKNGKKQLRKFEVFRVNTNRQVRNWFSMFRSGDTSLKDEAIYGRLSDVDQDSLGELVECNPAKELENELLTSTHSNPYSVTAWKR